MHLCKHTDANQKNTLKQTNKKTLVMLYVSILGTPKYVTDLIPEWKQPSYNDMLYNSHESSCKNAATLEVGT